MSKVGVRCYFEVVFVNSINFFDSKLISPKIHLLKPIILMLFLRIFFYRNQKSLLSSDISRDKRLHVNAQQTSVGNTS